MCLKTYLAEEPSRAAATDLSRLAVGGSADNGPRLMRRRSFAERNCQRRLSLQAQAGGGVVRPGLLHPHVAAQLRAASDRCRVWCATARSLAPRRWA